MISEFFLYGVNKTTHKDLAPLAQLKFYDVSTGLHYARKLDQKGVLQNSFSLLGAV